MFFAYGLEDIPRVNIWYKSRYPELGSIRFVNIDRLKYKIESSKKWTVTDYDGPYKNKCKDIVYGLTVARSTIKYLAKISYINGNFKLTTE